MPGGRNSPAIARCEDDDLLARVLITNWTLATGRILPPGVAPQSLTEDELISFWADDQMAAAGGTGPDRDDDIRLYLVGRQGLEP